MPELYQVSVSVVGLLLAMTNAVLGLAAISRKRRLKKRVLYVLIEFSSLSNKNILNNFL
jgi:uncharacterized protein YlxP (DUF503 family)